MGLQVANIISIYRKVSEDKVYCQNDSEVGIVCWLLIHTAKRERIGVVLR